MRVKSAVGNWAKFFPDARTHNVAIVNALTEHDEFMVCYYFLSPATLVFDAVEVQQCNCFVPYAYRFSERQQKDSEPDQ